MQWCGVSRAVVMSGGNDDSRGRVASEATCWRELPAGGGRPILRALQLSSLGAGERVTRWMRGRLREVGLAGRAVPRLRSAPSSPPQGAAAAEIAGAPHRDRSNGQETPFVTSETGETLCCLQFLLIVHRLG